MKDTRNTQGGAESSGIRARAGGTTFYWTEELEKAIVSLLSPPHPCMQMQSATIFESLLAWLIPLILPWSFPETPCYPICCPTQATRSDFFTQPVLVHVANFPTISQRFSKPKQAASVCPLSLAEAVSPDLEVATFGLKFSLSQIPPRLV